MLTEFGGVTYQPEPDKPWHGYGIVRDSEAFLSKYRELVDAILDSPAIAGFCYTQLTDTGQETNGLLTEDRVPKLDPEAVREVTARPSAAVPAAAIAQVKDQSSTSPSAE